MANTIKAYTSYNERTNTRFYTHFEIVESIPQIGDKLNLNYGDDETVISVKEISLDPEQGNDDVYNYDYYEVEFEYLDIDDEKQVDTLNYAILRNNEDMTICFDHDSTGKLTGYTVTLNGNYKKFNTLKEAEAYLEGLKDGEKD